MGSKEAQANTNTIFLAGQAAGIPSIDTKDLVTLHFGVQPKTIKRLNKKETLHRNRLISSVDRALGIGQDISRGTRKYLTSDKVQHYINAYYNAEDDDVERNRILAELQSGAPNEKAKMEISKIFSKDGWEMTQEALSESFGRLEDYNRSRYEQFKIWETELMTDPTEADLTEADRKMVRQALVGMGIEGSLIEGLSTERMAGIGRILAASAAGVGRVTGAGASVGIPDSQAALNISLALAMQAIAQEITGNKKSDGLNIFSFVSEARSFLPR